MVAYDTLEDIYSFTEEGYSIRIFATNGIAIWDFQISKDQIDVSKLPKGIYFLELRTSEQIAIDKYVKE